RGIPHGVFSHASRRTHFSRRALGIYSFDERTFRAQAGPLAERVPCRIRLKRLAKTTMFNLTTSFCIGRVASNELLNYAICKRNEGPNLDRTQSNHLPPALFPAVLSDFHVLRSEEHTSELQSRFDLVCR